eukprot:s4002_g4.t1
MKLRVHVLLLALRVISAHKCDESNECDISSHLHIATKAMKVAKETLDQGRSASYFINEFRPNPPGPDPTIQLVEISGGTKDDPFSGCIWTVEADPPGANFKRVDKSNVISGTFDANGLLVVPIDDLENPSFTIVLSALPCPDPNLNDDITDPLFLPSIGTIYDAIGVPDVPGDVTNLHQIRTDLNNPPGTDLLSIATGVSEVEPILVFRDGAIPGDLYQVNPGNTKIFDALGNEVSSDAFNIDPLNGDTFGGVNPTRLASTVIGDPHLHTMDGGHYTLLREGSFLLWRFGLPQPHVEWQIFAHYAGRQSFTKGLLLVDTSGSEPSSMEITSERCEWQTQSDSTKWSSVSSEVPEVILSSSSSRMKLVGNQRKDMKKIQLFVADEKDPVATLKVMCRQGRHINVKLYMANQKWKPFVSGELKGKKDQEHKPSSKTSMLQLAAREDQEFEVKKSWAELGGSSHAQQYLQTFAEHRQTVGFTQMCDPQSQADARALCQKHFGSVADSSYFEECVYDVCSGAGEVAAEMAAEMLKF